MAIFHLHLKTIKRALGRMATAACAYRAGEKIWDERTATEHDYSRRSGVSDTFLLFAAGVPAELQNREALWNGAEKTERRKDAVVARELILALPWELNREQRRALASRMGCYLVHQLGVAVDVCIHEPSWRQGHDIRNHHAHIMFTTRRVGPDGFGEKTRELDVHRTGREIVKAMRRAWEDFCNEALAKAGHDSRVDCRTLVEQGIFDRIAQIHKGPKVQAMLDRGVNPANIYKLDGLDQQQEQESRKKSRIPYDKLDQGRNRGQWNDQILETNVIRAGFGPEPLEVQIRKILANIDSLMHTIPDLESFIPRALLPEWVRKKVEWAWIRAAALLQRFFDEQNEEKRREHEEREGKHAKMQRIREEIARLKEELRRKEALQRLYMRIEHQAITRPMVYTAPAARPTRELTNYQYKVELHFKAEKARAAVPPEYRPRIERPVAHAVAGKGAFAQATAELPRDNGGLAKCPPPISPAFNVQADPVPVQPYKQKVRVGFGIV